MKKACFFSILMLIAVAMFAQPREQLLERLKKLQKHGIMFGHQDDPFYGLGWNDRSASGGHSDVLATCGDYPAVMGFDIGGIEKGDEKNLDSVPFARIREELLAQLKRGGIAAISWHPRNPLTGGNAWDVKDSTVVRNILPGGSQHLKFLEWMKRVSAFLQSLRDDEGRPVSVIFRPWHENNGSWFWWGKKQCTAAEYQALWCMLQDHLLADGLTNLVWSWSPNLGLNADEMDTYPGDERVDIIGLDAYQWGTEQDFVRQLNEDLTLLTQKVKDSKKLLALTECGYQTLPDSTWWTRVLQPQIEKYALSYFLVWRNAGDHEYFAPSPKTKDAPDFRKMVKNKRILMLKDIK